MRLGDARDWCCVCQWDLQEEKLSDTETIMNDHSINIDGLKFVAL